MQIKSIVKKILFVIVFAIIRQFVFAQKIDVKWSDKQKLTFQYSHQVMLENGKRLLLKTEDIYSYGKWAKVKLTRTYKYVLADNYFVVEKEKTVEVSEDSSMFQGFEIFGKNVFLIYSKFDKGAKTKTFTAQKVNQETLEMSAEITLGVYDWDEKSYQTGPYLLRSEDLSKALIITNGIFDKKRNIDENKKFYCTFFDKDLNKVSEKIFVLPSNMESFTIYEYRLTNEGNINILLKHYNKEGNKQYIIRDKEKVASFEFKLFLYEPKNGSLKEIAFKLNDVFVTYSNTTFDKSGKLATLIGLYTKKYQGNISGIFYANIDLIKKEIIDTKLVEFPIEMVTLVDKGNFGSDKKSDPGLFADYKITNSHRRANSSVDIVMQYQERYSTAGTLANGKKVDYGDSYIYGDVVDANIAKDGKVTFTRIPLNQRPNNPKDVAAIGITSLVHNDNLIVLYNDYKGNLERDLTKKADNISTFENSVFVAATINSQGELKREILFSNGEDDYITLTNKTIKNSENSYIIRADFKKFLKERTRYGVLTIQ
jgi:hypothetical protein